MSLLAKTLLSACEGSKPKELDTHVSRYPPATDIPRAQPRGTASYTAFSIITEARLGIPLYPGASSRDGGTWHMTDRVDEGAQSLMMATSHSHDAVEKVADFYAHELGVPSAQLLRVPTRNGFKLSITVEDGDWGRPT